MGFDSPLAYKESRNINNKKREIMAISNPTSYATVRRLGHFCEKINKYSSKVENVSANATMSESPAIGAEVNVIYVNTSVSTVTVTIEASNTVKTPNGQNISISIPTGGYGEASFSNIGGTIYARGV